MFSVNFLTTRYSLIIKHTQTIYKFFFYLVFPFYLSSNKQLHSASQNYTYSKYWVAWTETALLVLTLLDIMLLRWMQPYVLDHFERSIFVKNIMAS